MEISQYRISELADKAGVTKRTIHYYMGRGLLPPPNGAGLGTTYSDEHLYRVILIKKLQDAYLPLEEIKKRMSGMSMEDVRRSLEGEAPQMNLQEMAAEYNASESVNADACVNTSVNTNTNANSITKANANVVSSTNAKVNAVSSTNANTNTNAYANVTVGIAGTRYERLTVGFGLEIHFPADSLKARGLAEKLYEYAEKMMKEG